MTDDLDDLKRREEAKREANWDARERWRVIQETMTWAAQQIGRNTPAACKAKERRIRISMGELPPDEAARD
jgi:hypothetical protein